jgi:hypothetical protein
LSSDFNQIKNWFYSNTYSGKKQASDIVIRKINHYFLLCNFFSKYFISSSLKQCSISFNTWSICWPELIFDKCMTFENDANKPNWSRISR